eukprot:scaffold18728_cov121-Isochrysis_galbana.AAC.1
MTFKEVSRKCVYAWLHTCRHAMLKNPWRHTMVARGVARSNPPGLFSLGRGPAGTRFTLGAQGRGPGGSFDAHYRGIISEVIMLDYNPAEADRQRIVGYLAHKWGLVANLPADHPYKSAAP